MTIILFFLLLFVVVFLGLLNKLLLKTNWYNNTYAFTKEIFTLRERNRGLLKIVNLGSNPALFSFLYESVLGQNWATGTQGPEFDLAILKKYVQYIEKGGIVLIPIVAFSSCTPYLWHVKTTYLGNRYYARLAKLTGRDCDVIPNYSILHRWMKYPLLCQPSSFRFIIRDQQPENRHLRTEQAMSLFELRNDAERWMLGWMKEFDIKNLEAPLDARMELFHEECAEKFAEIVKFCKERGLHPMLIFPPMTSILNDCFSETIKETYVYSFVKRIQKRVDVEFLDYMSHPDFASPSLYFNSFFLNLRGRKLFTQKVLEDIGLIIS